MSVWLYFMVYWIDYMLTVNMTALKVTVNIRQELRYEGDISFIVLSRMPHSIL
jgi:hypothetical protein